MDHDEIERIFRQLLADSPNDARIIGHLAVHMCYGRKDYDEAERLYRRAIEVAPNNAKTVCDLARFLARTGRNAGEADRLFRRALELEPNDARINCAFAYLKHDRKNYDEAEHLFRRAIELAPNDVHTNFGSALFFHHARQDYAAAESFYRKAVELEPNDAYYNRQLAEFLWNVRKDLQEAEYFYRASIHLDPEDPETTDDYLSLLLENGRTAEAASVVDRAWAFNKGANSQLEAITVLYQGLISRLNEEDDQIPLRYLKSLMTAGFKRYSGNLESHIVAFSASLPERDQALYRALAAAILDDQKVKDLEMVERWREMESPPVDS